MSKQSVSEELIWAKEVMEVYKNLGSLPNSRNWSSPSAQALYDWVHRDEKNSLKFMADMTLKATGILAKANAADVSDAVLEIDAKTIGDLKQLLVKAVHASGDVGRVAPEPVLAIEDLF